MQFALHPFALKLSRFSLALSVQVRAEKQITIEQPPNVLTVHLKRFQYGGYGSKITRHVEFGTELNLQHFMSDPASAGPQVWPFVAKGEGAGHGSMGLTLMCV
jgi:hypothetical protein